MRLMVVAEENGSLVSREVNTQQFECENQGRKAERNFRVKFSKMEIDAGYD